ncbi:MAG: DUF3552 domain-containing protein, partial [Lentisphaeria bacterium]|nr:DUF3552 domain-containing protein [Lentisphaeria bacterium]
MDILYGLIGAAVGAAIVFFVQRKMHQDRANAASEVAQELKKAAQLEAENICHKAEVEAKDELLRVKTEFDDSTKDERRELGDREKKMNDREEKLDNKMDEIQTKLLEVSERDRVNLALETELRSEKEEMETIRQRQFSELSRVAELSQDDARAELMQKLEGDLDHERGSLIRRSNDTLKRDGERQAQKVIVGAMQRMASDCAYDRTTATIPLPSDEMKGRIIGREGRNIRVFEAETGVNVLIDDTPSAVVISCFEPVRREVARIALVRLVEDGRIHPTRVEEVVAKAREDIANEIILAGEDAVHELHLNNVAEPVIELLGRLKFRYSYNQNVLSHSIEVANFMALIAAELNFDVHLAKRMGLFHDIGK